MNHAKCLDKQVRSANSLILSFDIVTTYYWVADKQAYQSCDGVDFSFYIWQQALLVQVVDNQTWCHSNYHNLLLIELERRTFFKRKSMINPGTLN